MHRFYSTKKNADGKIIITGPDVNHIRNVLRMKPLERIQVCDGKGTEYECIIETLDAGQVVADVVKEAASENELPVKITLYQGLPKKEKMELIIQKAVELGAAEIVPVAMKRCIVKLEDEKKEIKKRERWQMISESAAKQSKRGIIPEVEKVRDFPKAVREALAKGMVLIPYENANGMQTFRDAVKELTGEVAVFIGPEGGFEEEEIAWAMEEGAVPISLGKRILRTETAGLATLSILMYEIECAQEKGKREWKHI